MPPDRISDGRMSGTAFGTIVLHVTPESAVGGPLAQVRNGSDVVIRIDFRNKQIVNAFARWAVYDVIGWVLIAPCCFMPAAFATSKTVLVRRN